MWMTCATPSGAISARCEPLWPFWPPRLPLGPFLRGAPPPGASLDGGLFEFCEFRLSSSVRRSTSPSSISFFAASAETVFDRASIVVFASATCARSSSISLGPDMAKVDHDRDLLSIPNSERREMIRLSGGRERLHRDYRLHSPAQVIRYRDRIEFRNAGHSLVVDGELGRRIKQTTGY